MESLSYSGLGDKAVKADLSMRSTFSSPPLLLFFSSKNRTILVTSLDRVQTCALVVNKLSFCPRLLDCAVGARLVAWRFLDPFQGRDAPVLRPVSTDPVPMTAGDHGPSTIDDHVFTGSPTVTEEGRNRECNMWSGRAPSLIIRRNRPGIVPLMD